MIGVLSELCTDFFIALQEDAPVIFNNLSTNVLRMFMITISNYLYDISESLHDLIEFFFN